MRIVELEAENRVLEATMDKLIAAKSIQPQPIEEQVSSFTDYPMALRVAKTPSLVSGGRKTKIK